LLDEPLKSKAVARLNQLVKQNGNHPTTGFWSSIELLLALSANGCNDEAACMLDQDTMPSWGYMARHGTTFWEAFDANARNLSLNHWTHSAVNEWLWRNVAGLNPNEQSPGYQSFTIYPRPTAEVSWCRSTYNSIRGPIVSNWRCHGDGFNLDVTVPANTTATVVVPTIDSDTVKESGILATQAEGVKLKLVGIGPGTATYQVGSGDYHFTSQIRPISAYGTLNGTIQTKPATPHATSKDIALIDPAFEHGYDENLVQANADGEEISTLSINNSTSNRASYSVWTRDLYWGFLGWAQAGDESVLPVMKSSLRLLIMVQHKNQALGQSASWPVHDGRFYISQAYMLGDLSVAMGFYPYDSESQADFLLLACNYWKMSGDRAFMESIWPDIEYVTQTLQLLDTDGNSLPDATEGTCDYQGMRNCEEPLMCAKTSLAYTSVAGLARALGKDVYAGKLDKLAATIKTTMNRNVADGGLWDPANGCYVDMRKLTGTGPQIDDAFVPYENLVPMWCGMTSGKQNDSIFAKLDANFDEYYNLKYGPEYCAPAVAHHLKSAMGCSSVPWLGFLDVYLRGKTGHEENRSKIYHLLISHAFDAAGIPFSEGAGIAGMLTGNAGRTWDNGNFFQMLICGIYGLEKSKDGILITAPEKIDGVPLTELKNVRWRGAVYNFEWRGNGNKLNRVMLDDKSIRKHRGAFNLNDNTGIHEVVVELDS
jgi:hypothetical protein